MTNPAAMRAPIPAIFWPAPLPGVTWIGVDVGAIGVFVAAGDEADKAIVVVGGAGTTVDVDGDEAGTSDEACISDEASTSDATGGEGLLIGIVAIPEVGITYVWDSYVTVVGRGQYVVKAGIMVVWVQGQSVIVSVVASVTVYVLLP